MLQTKYGVTISKDIVKTNINRLTNQTWKLIPMRENKEDWKMQIETVLIEIIGLNEILSFNPTYLQLLSKLEGLLVHEVDFSIYRKTVFETISLLQGLNK